MKPNMAMAATVAGILFLACAGRAYGGLFGLGDSGKSTEAKKTEAARTSAGEIYDPNRIASGPKITPKANKNGSSGGGWFGLGKQSSKTQPSKESLASLGSKPKKDKNESTSWWNSMFKPKEPPPPKSTSEWMKLKPVRY